MTWQELANRDLADRMRDEMVARLDLPRNIAKGHWNQSLAYYLFSRLMEEVEELRTAIYEGHSIPEVWGEAADIANFAAMIASNNE